MFHALVHESPQLIEAEVRTQRAMTELATATSDGFLRYQQLAGRLEAYDRHLAAVEANLHDAGYLNGNGRGEGDGASVQRAHRTVRSPAKPAPYFPDS